MRKLIFTTILICTALAAHAGYNVTSAIYDGNGQQCGYWANVGDMTDEVLTEKDMPDEEGAPDAAKYLEITRVQESGREWHGIGFDLSGLNTTLSAGNQIAMWVKKDKAENVKLELHPEDGWKYLVFDFSGQSEDIQGKQLGNMFVQVHTGGNDGQTATIQVTGIVKGFDLNDRPAPSAINETEVLSISTSDGRISCEGEFTVYDLAGRDVTAQNGNLKGVYVVICGDNAAKVVVD